MSIVGNIIKPIVGNIVGGIVGGAVADPNANLAWSAVLSEYQRSGANATDADFELKYIIDGVDTTSPVTPAGLLLPTSTAGLWFALASANDPPVHGARWDAGKPYDNVSAGSSTPLTVLSSLYSAPAYTNSALYSRDATNAAWTASNMTTAFDATGIDGVASNGSTLTATAANATLLQTVTATSAEHAGQFILRRKTGTGNVDITIDGGTTWTTVTLTTDYQDFYDSATVANPQFGVRIVTSADAVEMGNIGLVLTKSKVGITGSAPIFTDGATVTTPAIEMSYDILNHADNQGAYYCEWTSFSDFNERIGTPTVLSFSGVNLIYNVNDGGFSWYDGSAHALVVNNFIRGNPIKLSVVYDSVETLREVNSEGIKTEKSYNGNAGGSTPLAISLLKNLNTPCLIRNVRRYDLNYTEAKAKIDELMAL